MPKYQELLDDEPLGGPVMTPVTPPESEESPPPPSDDGEGPASAPSADSAPAAAPAVASPATDGVGAANEAVAAQAAAVSLPRTGLGTVLAAASTVAQPSKSSYLPPRIEELQAEIDTLELEMDKLLAEERYAEVKEVRRRIGRLRTEIQPLVKRRERQVRRDKNRRASEKQNPLDPRIIEHHAEWSDEEILAEYAKEIRADESGKGLVAGVAFRLGLAAARVGVVLTPEVLKELAFAEAYKVMLRTHGAGELFCTRGNEVIRRRLAGDPVALMKVKWLRRHPIPTHEAYRVDKFEEDWVNKWLGRWALVMEQRIAEGNLAYPWERADAEDDDEPSGEPGAGAPSTAEVG